ncbi:MAG: phosphoribosylformylglycinamidine synthase subunit PurQ [Bacteriovoracaceae bacterium]|nr:phosphoribosylformylglycinamidine synthase subunit PurQ [Bacteriovoracaceae bacterium]
MTTPGFIILSGDGINCENETALAFREVGANADIIHINELLERPHILKNYQGMAIPGGFSFGDELGSGQVLAMKIKYKLHDAMSEMVANGGAIIGICNGFQVLTKLGLLPSVGEKRQASLTTNESGHFINRWVSLEKETNTVCKWLMDIPDTFSLPVRHGEGRLVFTSGEEESIFNKLSKNGQIALYYDEDINGSYKNIAGLCDESGMIFGLMPHPEASMFKEVAPIHSQSGTISTAGRYIFGSIVSYIKNS